ncbi:MAG: hypothetical protein FIA99_10160, partial [Ruminiclostridium sp.]|nr:hypothetical protein [Ruminiclostridium sp.]
MSTGTVSPGIPASASSEKPLTLLRLLILLIKGYFKSIPSMVIWTIVRAAAAFLIVLILHTYLIVVKNEGFAPDPNNPLYRLMSFPGNKAGAAAFWGIAAFLLSSLAGRIWFGGPVKLFADFAGTPNWVIKSFKKAEKSGLPVLLGAVAAALIASLFIKNNYLIITTVIGIFLSYISRQQGLWFLFLSTALSDFKKLFMKNKTVNHGIVSVFVLGLMLGLILTPVIPLKPYGEIFAAALCIAGIILLQKKKLTPGAAMWALSFLVFQAILFKVTGVYADDGGWQAAGGTLG